MRKLSNPVSATPQKLGLHQHCVVPLFSHRCIYPTSIFRPMLVRSYHTNLDHCILDWPIHGLSISVSAKLATNQQGPLQQMQFNDYEHIIQPQHQCSSRYGPHPLSQLKAIKSSLSTITLLTKQRLPPSLFLVTISNSYDPTLFCDCTN